MAYFKSRWHAAGVCAGVVWLVAAPLVAQSRPAAPARPGSPRPQAAGAPTLGAGFAALDAGRTEEAGRIAAVLLRETPGSHAAALLQIAALAYGPDPLRALAAYDAWRAGRRTDDPFLLALVGEGVARRLAASASEGALRLAAAELLVRHGLPGARALLAGAARISGPAGTAALARQGDAAAARRAAGALPTLVGSARATGVDQLAGATDPAVTAAVAGLAGDPDPMVRIAVAGALGRSGDLTAAGPVLQRLLTDQSAQVQQAAAVALVRLGDPQGEAWVEKMLASGIGELVLAAAEALPADSARWTDRVRAVLGSDDPVERLRAARLLRDILPAEAGEVLRAGLASENGMLRDEAARLAMGGLPAAGADWRQMLADPSGWVQLAAAGLLLDQAAAPL
jgi:HEAT repeat protein